MNPHPYHWTELLLAFGPSRNATFSEKLRRDQARIEKTGRFGKLYVDRQVKVRKSLRRDEEAEGQMGLLGKLFEPAWMTEINYKAKEAVARVNDPETLRRIVAEAPLTEARFDAMRKLDDQALYREVATISEDVDLACRTARYVDDLSTLESFMERGFMDRDPMTKRCILMRFLSVKKDALNALIHEVSEIDDAARLVDLAVSDLEDDAPLWPRYDRRAQPYRSLQIAADNLRMAVVGRLADLCYDSALADVVKRAADDKMGELAALSIRDKGVLDRLVLDGGLRPEDRNCAISHLDNADLLRELVDRMDPLAARSSSVARRLSKLPCTDGKDRKWVTISEVDNGALGMYAEGPRYNDWVKRCSKCGLEVEGSSKLGL